MGDDCANDIKGYKVNCYCGGPGHTIVNDITDPECPPLMMPIGLYKRGIVNDGSGGIQSALILTGGCGKLLEAVVNGPNGCVPLELGPDAYVEELV